jgi:hypothetical protein
VRTIAIVLLLILLFTSTAQARTFDEFVQEGNFGIDVTDRREEVGSDLYEERFRLTNDEHISIKFENASIADILSVIALHMGNNVLFVEEPIITSFEILDVEPMVALEMLLRREGLSYIERDNLIIVGEPSRILDAFFDLVVLYEIQLVHITARQFDEYLGTLGVPLERLVIEGNPRSVWVRGLPQELVLVRDIRDALDRPENVVEDEEEIDIATEMVRVDLEYISPDYLVELARGLDFNIDILQPERGREVIWLRGTPANIEEVQEFIDFVDDPSNIEERLPMERIDLLFITADILMDVARQARLEVDIYTVPHNCQAVWVQGTEKEIEYLEEVVEEIDTAANQFITKDFAVFAYQLDHVTPVDVIDRIREWEFSDLKVIGFNFPQFGNDVLVLCPPETQDYVIEALNAIDGERRDIRVPVMTAQGVYPEDVLQEWANLLVELLHDRGVGDYTFVIPEHDLLGGMGRYIDFVPEGEEEPVRMQVVRKIMYAETTPDRIQLIMEMLRHTGAPGILEATPVIEPPEEPEDPEEPEENNEEEIEITAAQFAEIEDYYHQGTPLTYEDIQDIVGGPGDVTDEDPFTVYYDGTEPGSWARFIFDEAGFLDVLDSDGLV